MCIFVCVDIFFFSFFCCRLDASLSHSLLSFSLFCLVCSSNCHCIICFMSNRKMCTMSSNLRGEQFNIYFLFNFCVYLLIGRSSIWQVSLFTLSKVFEIHKLPENDSIHSLSLYFNFHLNKWNLFTRHFY